MLGVWVYVCRVHVVCVVDVEGVCNGCGDYVCVVVWYVRGVFWCMCYVLYVGVCLCMNPPPPPPSRCIFFISLLTSLLFIGLYLVYLYSPSYLTLSAGLSSSLSPPYCLLSFLSTPLLLFFSPLLFQALEDGLLVCSVYDKYYCESFSGSASDSAVDRVWGPFVGWSFALIATVFGLVATVLVALIPFHDGGYLGV